MADQNKQYGYQYYCSNCKQTTFSDQVLQNCKCGGGSHYFKCVGPATPGINTTSSEVYPKHYHGREVMDIINKFGLSFCLGNVVKYVLRQSEKGGLVDLEKALWYLTEEIRIQKEMVDPK